MNRYTVSSPLWPRGSARTGTRSAVEDPPRGAPQCAVFRTAQMVRPIWSLHNRVLLGNVTVTPLMPRRASKAQSRFRKGTSRYAAQTRDKRHVQDDDGCSHYSRRTGHKLRSRPRGPLSRGRMAEPVIPHALCRYIPEQLETIIRTFITFGSSAARQETKSGHRTSSETGTH